MSEKRLAVVGVILWLVIVIGGLICANGCAMLQQVKDAICGTETEEIVDLSPTKQLWHTVRKSNWLVTLAIPIIALGAVAMFNGAVKLGMSAIIFGSVNLFMALATSRFAFWMALFGLVGSGAAVAASIVAKNKALKEIVFGVQTIKGNVKEDPNLQQLSFQKMMSETLDKQIKSTKKIVQKIKNKAILKGEI